MEIPQTGRGMNSKHLGLTVLEARKSKIKMPADSLPGFQTAPSYCTSYGLSSVSWGQKSSSLRSILIKTLVLSDEGPTLMASFNLVSKKVLFPNLAYMGGKSSTEGFFFGGGSWGGYQCKHLVRNMVFQVYMFIEVHMLSHLNIVKCYLMVSFLTYLYL